MADDFFGELDQRLSQLKDDEGAAAERQRLLGEFRAAAALEMRAVADKYANELHQRGITAQVGGSGDGVTFEMHWHNGDVHALSVAPEPKTGQLQIHHISTDKQTRREYMSTVATTFDQSNWSRQLFEEELQNLVREYLDFATDHGGIA